MKEKENPYYNTNIFKQAIYPRWWNLWLWLFPTYVVFEWDDIINYALYYKVVFGKVIITKQEELPRLSDTFIENEIVNSQPKQ